MTETNNAPLPEEHLAIIKLRGTVAGKLICTPDQLDDLAAGWLLAQGVTIDAETPVVVEQTETGSVVHVDVAPPDSFTWHAYAAAGFDASYFVQTGTARVATSAGMDAGNFEKQLQTVFNLFREQRGAGGYHHAAIAGESEIHALAIDISRHNAVDKVIGQAVRNGAALSRAAIFLSGRISADIAMKGARAGVPVIATRSLPTRQAVALAEAAELTLVCRALDHRRAVYGPLRLVQ